MELSMNNNIKKIDLKKRIEEKMTSGKMKRTWNITLQILFEIVMGNWWLFIFLLSHFSSFHIIWKVFRFSAILWWNWGAIKGKSLTSWKFDSNENYFGRFGWRIGNKANCDLFILHFQPTFVAFAILSWKFVTSGFVQKLYKTKI